MVNTGEAQTIHCSETPDGSDKYDHFDIDLWHMARGFKRQLNAKKSPPVPHLLHVGYHAIILVDGRVIAGRGLKEVGAHTHGWNHKAWGVCLMGRSKFTMPQWLSLRDLVENWENQGAKNIFGHRKVSRKDCPGFSVQAWLDGGREPMREHLL